MRLLTFSKRNTLEMLRDPISVAMGVGFPVIVLALLTIIQKSIPSDEGNPMALLFSLEMLTPGIAVFGLSFISLFSATLISKDRTTSYLTRLYASPLTATDFILGYTLPMLPIAIMQSIICFLFAFCLGLTPSWNALLVVLALIPADIMFIAIGLICGTLFNDKQVGGICGALLTNLAAWLSGTWIPLESIGGAFLAIAKALPFYHAVQIGDLIMAGTYEGIMGHMWWVLGYTVVLSVLAAVLFAMRMKKDA